MLLPSDLLPVALGLQWGIPQEQCLEILGVAPSRRSPLWARVTLPLRGDAVEIVLNFEDGGLQALSAVLFSSQESWDDDFPVSSAEEFEALVAEYEGRFREVVAQATAALGTPDYDGAYDDPSAPDDQAAWQLAFWDRPAARLFVELDQPDSEFPVTVTVGVRRRGDA